MNNEERRKDVELIWNLNKENNKLKEENKILKEDLQEIKDEIIKIYNNVIALDIIREHEIEVL